MNANAERCERLTTMLSALVEERIEGLRLDGAIKREHVGTYEGDDGAPFDVFTYVVSFEDGHGKDFFTADASFIDSVGDEMAVGFLYGIILGDDGGADTDEEEDELSLAKTKVVNAAN